MSTYKILILTSVTSDTRKSYEYYKDIDNEGNDWECSDLTTLANKYTELLSIYPMSKLTCVDIEEMIFTSTPENLNLIDISNIIIIDNESAKTVTIKFVIPNSYVIFGYGEQLLDNLIVFLQEKGYMDITASPEEGIQASYTSEKRPSGTILIQQGFLKIINTNTSDPNYTNNPKVLTLD